MPPSTAPKTNILRRFRRNRRGSAAVEFALVAPIFFAVLFAIIELALVFFASQILETVTQDSARLIMTGQAQSAVLHPGAVQGRRLRQAHRDVRLRRTVSRSTCRATRRSPPSTLPTRSMRYENFVPPNNYLSRRRRRYRRRAAVLSMAAVRHRPRLQSREHAGSKRLSDRDRRVQERTFLGTSRRMKPMRSPIWLRCACGASLRIARQQQRHCRHRIRHDHPDHGR